MGIAVGRVGVDAGGLDREFSARSGQVVTINGERAGVGAEISANFGDHRVAHPKADGGVERIDDPGASGWRQVTHESPITVRV
ncbi:unannotated protein [freshwater metagenome]|uniref:Unannotated protein n=1 Tax=freshwater metagenome TaxID=449393 RepID=A0A6J7AB81_9ZZZZ